MRNRRFWLRFHRTLGLYAGVWVLIIASSGLVLSFSQSLNLEQIFVSWQSRHYQTQDFDLQFKHGRVFVNNNDEGVLCQTPAVALVQKASRLLMACQNNLYWLDAQGQMIDALAVSKEMRPLSRAFADDQQIYILTQQGLYSWQFEQAQLHRVSPEQAQRVENQAALDSIEAPAKSLWEWLLTLHTGLIVGDLGRWLSRLTALSLMVLALTGLKNALTRR